MLDVLGKGQDELVLEKEQAHRGHLEHEVVFGGVVLGAFKNKGQVVRLELHAGRLFRVEGGGEIVLVQREVLRQPLLLVLGGGHHHPDGGGFRLGGQDLAVLYLVSLYHQ